MTQYLILGGCGFIGRHVALALARRGESVVVADVAAPPAELANVPVTFRQVVPGQTDWQALTEDCDVIHHYAWSTIPQTANDDPIRDLDDNVRTTLGLLDVLRHQGKKRLIFASSGGTVYGRLKRIPAEEHHSLAPITAYGASKACVELYLGFYRAHHGMDCRVARISNPFGAGQDARRKQQGAASAFLFKALAGEEITIWGDGSVIRDYIHIADLTRGLIALSDASLADHHDLPIYNLGSGVGISLNEIVETLRNRLGLTATVNYLPSRNFDIPASILDIRKSKDLLEWSPQMSFAEGYSLMFDDLRKNKKYFSTLPIS
ncbi:NAD-dependent epimerase [Rhodospirillum rubrum]|uniref:UDP-glucose 4-epimerase n=1 Tax=Rhodospirillum rubrum (strain ATCC 11170 / ATH 1.1.1 / DSM 467 / LMG 4362 / NCIMB 8255 / S1) TaxID=269796 RepID=Q2RMP3_RHORT|nr:NAD-dependent epimerase/dehydratase family protein [Rhodospirillum rubrum]ABC24602.1 NAD-dependent epimerase/dehydratase [Rhodospirillum rubrum ATCC 11170]MBK1664087.1 NAD-dependent epimerase [Rhodospirillum rubrum]MBK1676060.1 NAD-dependent epimerase [Rhodospirillum rubrum]QXG82510.1 NAD-dependent epimerase/dehydratase family protein [Rhodospirillum rubrum]